MKNPKSPRRAWLSIFLSGLAPAVVLFLSIPGVIYRANVSEFDGALQPLLPYALLPATSALVWGAATAGRKRLPVDAAAAGLFWVGLFFFLCDLTAPVQLGTIQGELETPGEPLSLTLLELGLAVALIGASRFVPRALVHSAGAVFVTVLAAGAVYDLASAWPPPTETATQEIPADAAGPAQAGDRPNIYHLTFDAYSSLVFLEELDRLGSRDRFNGFVFFPHNRVNYFFTTLSTTSYMTGTLFQGASLRAWSNTMRTSGLIKDFADQGYKNWTYVLASSRVHERAGNVTTNQQMGETFNRFLKMLSFGDLWLLRVAPNFLQADVYWESRGLVSRSYSRWTGESAPASSEDARTVSSLLLMKQLIHDERRRPASGQYVYGHIYLPHGPSVLDEDCEYVPAGTSYEVQATCVTRMMVELINELKRLGRYESSIIVLHSDHGSWPIGLPPQETDQLGEGWPALVDNTRSITPASIDNQTRALLAIKRAEPGQAPLQVSGRMTQLLDLRPTLWDLAFGMSPSDALGLSVFSDSFPAERDIHMYLGYKQLSPAGDDVFVGDRGHSGSMHHLSIDRRHRWTRHPDLPTSLE